jgi:hypothetical protein
MMLYVRLVAVCYVRLSAPPTSPPTRHTTVFPRASRVITPPVDPLRRDPKPACPRMLTMVAPAINSIVDKITAPPIPAISPAAAPRPAPRVISPATKPAIRAPKIGMYPSKINNRNPATIPRPMLLFGLGCEYGGGRGCETF